ncbi:MAG: CDP-alcohol phosphatidyltransferase family protein [Planctomycetes bacterium]|nr:CDP-alcohol phosphatidyltransferase family protein [Planctomycetota bacterium]
MNGAVVGDRRPIKSRDTALAQRFAAWLVARRVSPDAISLFGMGAGLAAGIALAATGPWPAGERWLWAFAALGVQVRLLCNLFDGMVAIGSGRVSPLGELYNDLPDRVSDSAVLIGLGLAGGCPWLGCAAALLAMATAYVRTLGRALGAGSDFGGPMAKQQRMFVVTLVALYMALAPALWRPVLAGLGLPGLALVVIVVGSAWTVVRRLRNVARQLRGGIR